MEVLFSGQVPKDLSYPDENEDSYALCPEIGRIALSDGASESFDSKIWAKLLVQSYLGTAAPNQVRLSELIAEYDAHFDVPNMSWSKRAAFERGSFATLLGVEVLPFSDTINVFSIGDSLAVLLDGFNFLDSYPYAEALEFQQRPELFCTNPSHNSFVVLSDFSCAHQKFWEIKGKQAPTLLLMTDALGEWSLRNAQDGRPQWERLCSIDSIFVLESLVISEREKGEMRTDDVSLIRVEFNCDE